MGSRLLQITVNGRRQQIAARDSATLLELLRDGLQLTGTKQGCDGGECGACTVLVDGQPRLACITLAASVEAREVETIESLVAGGRLSALQRHEPRPSEAQIREALAGNLCRCTGYVKIIESVQAAAEGQP